MSEGDSGRETHISGEPRSRKRHDVGHVGALDVATLSFSPRASCPSRIIFLPALGPKAAPEA
eukprot:2379854-Pyramimonas_sp.AAC.2